GSVSRAELLKSVMVEHLTETEIDHQPARSRGGLPGGGALSIECEVGTSAGKGRRSGGQELIAIAGQVESDIDPRLVNAKLCARRVVSEKGLLNRELRMRGAVLKLKKGVIAQSDRVGPCAPGAVVEQTRGIEPQDADDAHIERCVNRKADAGIE